jgi:SAM-dependent methyltransferase
VRPLLGPLRDLRIFVRFVRERGVRHAGRIGALAVRGRLMAAADRRREAHFGVDSEGNIALGELAIESENRALGFPYVPSPGLLVDTLLANVGEQLSRFSFVDFGSGKGRVLLVASHYPFREVVGVEFSPELHETAEANIRRYQSPLRRCPRVRSVCADAATFALPAPDCVLYFNNPFAEPVFARVLANVQAAHESSRGKLYVLYQQLAGELETDRTQNIAILERSAFLRERHVRFPSRRSRYLLGSYDLRMFESVDPASTSSPQLALRRTPAVAAVKATRTGSHFGDTPTSRTSGWSNSRNTSRASARRPSRSRR